MSKFEINTPNDLMNVSPEQALETLGNIVNAIVNEYESKKSDNAANPDYEFSIGDPKMILNKLIPSQQIDKLSNSTLSYDEMAVLADRSYKRFWLQKAPSITIENYLKRFHQYCPASAASYLRTGIMLYDLAVNLRLLPLTLRNVHRTLGSSLVLSAKAIEDKPFSMKRYAVTCGVSQPDLASMELTLLLLLDCDMKVDQEFLINGIQQWHSLTQ